MIQESTAIITENKLQSSPLRSKTRSAIGVLDHLLLLVLLFMCLRYFQEVADPKLPRGGRHDILEHASDQGTIAF